MTDEAGTKAMEPEGAEILAKRKTMSLTAFTRTYNSLSKLLGTDCPNIALIKGLEDLEDRYSVLEDRCQKIMMLDGHESEFDDLLNEKHDIFTEIRTEVLKRTTTMETVSSVQNEATSSISTSESDTGNLIKSFKASLTLPRPEFQKFDGKASKFAEFMSYIETYVEANVDNPKQRLTLLIDTCDGLARDSIVYLIQSSDAEEAYKQAKQTLKELFGRKHQIIRAVIEECTDGPAIKVHDIEQLKRLVISMKKAQVTLCECGSIEELKGSDKLIKIYQRLPTPIQHKWNDKLFELQEKDRSPSIEHLCKLVESFVQSRDNEFTDSLVTSTTSHVMTKKLRNEGKPVYSLSNDKKCTCLLCKGSHYLNQCSEFLALNLKRKYEFISKSKLCRNCLHPGHIASKCKRRGLCKQCPAKHNDVLHDQNFNPANTNAEINSSDANNDTNHVFSVTKENVYHGNTAGITCVEVLIEGKDALYRCKAIVDQKSSVNLCSQRLMKRLNLPSTPFQTTFNVATGNYVVNGERIVKTKVYSRCMQNFVEVNDLLTVKKIPLSMNVIFSQDDIRCCDHLKGINIPQCSNSDEIDLLIGSGVPKAFHQFEQRIGRDDQIYAVKLTLGWDLVGPKRNVNNEGSCAAITSVRSDENVCLIGHVPNSCEILSNNLSKVFDQDFRDCSLFSSKMGPSPEDKQATSLVENSIEIDNEKFSVGIPWKQNPVNLPSNKDIVLKRLSSLKKRFQNDPSLLNAYSSEMEKMIENGFLEKSNSEDTNLCHYIPHHPVWHPRKNSIRIVWDCAMSLNDFIFEGPDLLNELTNVLIRFRRFSYALTSDIRKMYLNVRVPCKDRGALRVLWWPDGNISKEPNEYRAAVHIYGAKSSGFIANYCVQTLANETNDPVIRNILKNDLYVDDQASSIQSENQAIMIAKGLSSTLAKGGFHLTKFISNSVNVMNSISKNDHGNVSNDEHSILGLKWNVKRDELKLPNVILEKEVATRRSLLSAVAQMYDPLGFVSPAILPVKVVLQSKSSINWDEVDSGISECWSDYQRVLSMIEKFSIPRCYKPRLGMFEQPSHISLHGFSDASNVGYSAVVYIREIAKNGQVVISFVIGKSRVAPKFKGNISAATVPKLELNAAALLAKLVDKVKGCIELDIDEVFYWCDSQAVLSCISTTNKRFPVYWSNRLAIIHGLTNVEQWRYVPTKCNPADIGSRGIKSKDFAKYMQIWIYGPSFLTLSSERWPERSSVEQFESQIFLTNVKGISDQMNKESELLQRLISHYSKLRKLLDVVVKLLRFMKIVKSNDASLDEYEKAKVALIRFEQRLLVIPNLARLKPFLDQSGLYRVKGRLSKMEHIAYDERFPVILPRRSNLTKLIIQDVHEKSAHMGPNHVLCDLRSRFWVVSGKSAVKNVISNCRKCKEENAQCLTQIMSDLPEERGKPSYPFQCVGLDFFGPFYCKSRRQRVKRYGCIFVCLAIRAVHIECVNSLETSAFLCALTRFISRRGKPLRIYSDNGTNFRGAQDELFSIIKSINDAGLNYAKDKGFYWHFHPPQGSHHGGHYERFIRSVRRVLRGITIEQELSEDNLTTFLCEAEKILNDRPLTNVSSDPDDYVPLSPNVVLLLRGNSCESLFRCENVPKMYHRQAQFLANLFWKRWLKEYVSSLQWRQKWLLPKRNLKVGDLVFMCKEGYPRGKWPIAKVIEVHKSSDDLVRKVTIRDKHGPKMRPITALALLEASD